MTPRQRKHLRQLGLSDLEISSFEKLGLPPVLMMLFVGILLQAQDRSKAQTYPWWRDLGLEHRPTSRDAARTAYSQAMLKAHPDHGGSMVAMAKVKAAWERAQQEFAHQE